MGGEIVVCKFPDESKRARRLREAMGFNERGAQLAFANFLGVDRGRWNNVECGAPLSKEMALRIVRKFPGVTLDWLFLGRTEGLPRRWRLRSQSHRREMTRMAIRQAGCHR